MLTEYLSAIEGVEKYPIISLLIFIPFFLFVTIYIFRLKKEYLKYMSSLPLDDTDEKHVPEN